MVLHLALDADLPEPIQAHRSLLLVSSCTFTSAYFATNATVYMIALRWTHACDRCSHTLSDPTPRKVSRYRDLYDKS